MARSDYSEEMIAKWKGLTLHDLLPAHAHPADDDDIEYLLAKHYAKKTGDDWDNINNEKETSNE